MQQRNFLLVFLSFLFCCEVGKASNNPPLPLGMVTGSNPPVSVMSDPEQRIVYKTNNYYVACCPENCCPDCCSCSCQSFEQKPCVDWDNYKKRLSFCIYSVLEQSGRHNEKRSCTLFCIKSHRSCVNFGTDIRNNTGRCYDASRKCGSNSVDVSCDFCGCCIRKIEVGIPVVHEPIN